MLLLREHAFQEEGQGPPGHKPWLMAEKCLLPSQENQGLQPSPPTPALHCSPFPAAGECTPLLPPACSSGTATAWAGRAVLPHRARSQPGLASLTEPPLEAATGETLTNAGTQVWDARWGAESQMNELCSLDVELNGSTVGSLLFFSAPCQVFVPWLLYRQTNLLLLRQKFMMEIKDLGAFIFHHIILNDLAGPMANLALPIWKLIQLWGGRDKEKPRSHTSWGESKICLHNSNLKWNFLIFLAVLQHFPVTACPAPPKQQPVSHLPEWAELVYSFH